MPATETPTDPATPHTDDAKIGKRRVYLMKDLPPEVVAVAFAKTSRSPKAFDVIADELTETGSDWYTTSDRYTQEQREKRRIIIRHRSRIFGVLNKFVMASLFW